MIEQITIKAFIGSDNKTKELEVLNTLNELKEVLDQEAIAYQIENDLQLI